MEPAAPQVEVKPIGPVPRRSRRWKVAGTVAVFTGVLLWRLPLKLAVADVAAPRLGPAVSRDTSLGDFERMVFVRQALQQDEQLGALNLGVTVRGRVATLWGGIPSEELARRAESVLRGAAGITIVHNELRVEPRREAKKNLFALPASPASESPQAGSLLAPGSLTSLPGDRAAESQSGFTPQPTAEKPPEAVRVMPPLVITLRPPPFPDPPPFEERKVVPVAAAELTAALQRVQAGDTRFRQIRLEVQDGVVRLSGTVSQPGDMMAFAQLIAQVPGVKHVIMGNTRTPQRGALQLP